MNRSLRMLHYSVCMVSPSGFRVGRWLLPFLFSSLLSAAAQGTVPTFQFTAANHTLVVAGRDPAQGGTLIVPTLVVPVTLSFEAKTVGGTALPMKADADVPRVLRSPI